MSETFRAVEWMRQRRVCIDEEDKGLPWSVKSRRTEQALEGDPLWERLRNQVVRPRSLGLPPALQG